MQSSGDDSQIKQMRECIERHRVDAGGVGFRKFEVRGECVSNDDRKYLQAGHELRTRKVYPNLSTLTS